MSKQPDNEEFFASAVRFAQGLDPADIDAFRNLNLHVLQDHTKAQALMHSKGLKQSLSSSCVQALGHSLKTGSSFWQPLYNVRARFVDARFEILIENTFPNDAAVRAMQALAVCGWIGNLIVSPTNLAKLWLCIKPGVDLISHLSNFLVPDDTKLYRKPGRMHLFTQDYLKYFTRLQSLFTELDACEWIPPSVRYLNVSCVPTAARQQWHHLTGWDLTKLDVLHAAGLAYRTFRWLIEHKRLGALQRFALSMFPVEDESLVREHFISSLISVLFDASRLEQLHICVDSNHHPDCVADLLRSGKFVKLRELSVHYAGRLASLETVNPAMVPALEVCHLVDKNLDEVPFPSNAKWKRLPSMQG